MAGRVAGRLFLWIGAVALVVVVASIGCAQSDAGITTEVKAKLEADRNVSSSATIQVDTNKKIVTLSGKAASDAEKKRAVQVARGAQGVKEVVDNLAVDPSVAPPPVPEAGGSVRPGDSADRGARALIAGPGRLGSGRASPSPAL